MDENPELTKRGTPRKRAPGAGGRRDRAGRKPATTYAERYAIDTHGSSLIRVPNTTLAYLERIAAEQGLAVVEWLNRQEIDSRIL